MKNVLVTGGAGFIGSNFIRALLTAESSVHIFNLDALTYSGSLENIRDLPDESRHTFIRGNICDTQLVSDVLRDNKIDTIVHFAAESHVDRSILGPAQFIQTNIVGTFTLLDTAKNYWSESKGLNSGDYRFHHISTDEVFGTLNPGEPAWTEEIAYSPSSPYSASKASSDHLVRSYGHTYGFPFTLTNCSNNYGPYQFPEKLIPLMILNMKERKPLPVYGDGKNVRDWLYVEDHVAALWLILQKGKSGEKYNIGGENEWENIHLIRRLISFVAEETDIDPKELESLVVFVRDRPGHDRRYAIDCSKIKKELGWKQKSTFDEGLRQTVHWYLTNDGWCARVKSGEYQKWIEKNYVRRI